MRYKAKSKRTRKSDEGQITRFVYWSMLPEDLKVEILCRLECKQLIRLKCVSKAWHLLISNQCTSIISSPRFHGIIHTMHSIEEHKAFLHCCPSFAKHLMQDRILSGPDYLLKRLVPFDPLPETLQDCSNGVLLLVNTASTPRQYCICNLTTHQCIEVPVNVEHVVRSHNAFLIFDPRDMKCPNSFMVVVPREYSKHSLKLDVFSSRVRNWSSCMVPLHSFIDGSKLKEQNVYLNGILYMLSEDKYLVSVSLTSIQGKSTSSGRTILETAQAIELPGKNEFDCCGSFGVSRGNLVYSNSDHFIFVWVLENGARWVLSNKINAKEIILSNPFLLGPQSKSHFKMTAGLLKVCAFHPCSEKLFLVGWPLRILKYNPRTKKVKPHHFVCTRNQVDKVFPVSRCAVTLESVNV